MLGNPVCLQDLGEGIGEAAVGLGLYIAGKNTKECVVEWPLPQRDVFPGKTNVDVIKAVIYWSSIKT